MRPSKTHDELRSAFDDGSVLNSSKSDLEEYLLANGRARILSDDNRARNSEMGATLRELLAVRNSQRMHREAVFIAFAALVVAAASLVLSFLQFFQ